MLDNFHTNKEEPGDNRYLLLHNKAENTKKDVRDEKVQREMKTGKKNQLLICFIHLVSERDSPNF